MCAGERPFKCESCNYLAANQHEVTRHARQVHNGPKPLSCPYCDYKTADRSNYKKHVELHLNPRQFLCPLCKYAASKKCNLQYHIKSRHAGCNVAMDISKVKLRVKKNGPHGAEDSRDQLTNPGTTEEDVDRDSRDTNPINLSTRRSSRPGVSQAPQGDALEKVQEKTSPTDRDRLSRVKDQEKRITTRQKGKKAHEKVPEEELHPGSSTASKSPDSKAKTKVKKLQAEKTVVQGPPEDQGQVLNPDQPPSEDKRRVRPDKDKENQSSTSKKKGLNKSRKPGPQQVERVSKQADNSQQEPGKKATKEKAPKRRSDPHPDPHPAKTRRTKGSEKLRPTPEDTGKMDNVGSDGTRGTKRKKSRHVPGPEDNLSIKISGGPAEPHNPTENIKTEPHKSRPAKRKGSSGSSGPSAEAQASPPKPPSPTKPQLSLDTSPKPDDLQNTEEKAPDPSSPMAPQEPRSTPLRPAGPAEPAETCHLTSPPTTVLPVPLANPADPEDDEGIHSSHEGGSDLSDSVSEASEDSGLNSNGTGSGKRANDPETPTEEIPTPTELKAHMCIFCDRSFPLEAAYRRHLNRHLVNVYYMDNTGPQQ